MPHKQHAKIPELSGSKRYKPNLPRRKGEELERRMKYHCAARARINEAATGHEKHAASF
jgi:hypothetical protein